MQLNWGKERIALVGARKENVAPCTIGSLQKYANKEQLNDFYQNKH